MKNSLKNHSTASEAYEQTTKNKVIAVKVVTYIGESKTVEYYSYKSKFEEPEDLREDFPLALGSNQSIIEIDQFD